MFFFIFKCRLLTLKERKRLIIFSVYFCTNIYKWGVSIGVNRCFGFPNLKRQVCRWSLNRPPVSCLQSQSAGVLKTHTPKPSSSQHVLRFLHFLWACRIKQIVALKRAIFLAFYILRNHWMENRYTFKMVHLRFATIMCVPHCIWIFNLFYLSDKYS